MSQELLQTKQLEKTKTFSNAKKRLFALAITVCLFTGENSAKADIASEGTQLNLTVEGAISCNMTEDGNINCTTNQLCETSFDPITKKTTGTEVCKIITIKDEATGLITVVEDPGNVHSNN